MKELHIGAAKLGLLYTGMGIGSVVAAAFILPWGRAHYSPNTLTRLATYLLALVIFRWPLFVNRSFCWRRMDLRGPGTVASWATRHAGLGSRPNERHRHPVFSGSDSSGRGRKQTLPRQARSLAVPKCGVNARWPRLIGPHQLMRKETIQLFSYCG